MDEYNETAQAQAECASDNVNWNPPPQLMGALAGQTRPMTDAEYEQRNRDSRCQQAIYVLYAAKEVRENAALMAEVRQYIRDERNRLGAFLDTIGA